MLAVACEKAWLDPEWEVRCGSGSNKEAEMEEHQKLLRRMISSAEEGAGFFLAQNHEAG